MNLPNDKQSGSAAIIAMIMVVSLSLMLMAKLSQRSQQSLDREMHEALQTEKAQVKLTVENTTDCKTVIPASCTAQDPPLELRNKAGAILVAADGSKKIGRWNVKFECSSPSNTFAIFVSRRNNGTVLKDPLTKKPLDWTKIEGFKLNCGNDPEDAGILLQNTCYGYSEGQDPLPFEIAVQCATEAPTEPVPDPTGPVIVGSGVISGGGSSTPVVTPVPSTGGSSPSPAPAPIPKPAPTPAPTPTPVPTPKPAPAPIPAPVPKPAPAPIPAPIPKPAPIPAPVPKPAPTPIPVPTGGGFPAPAPAPIPKPAPAPIGGGFPAPAPAPIPKPAPAPIGGGFPAPAPTPIGGGFPAPAPTPIPKPAPTPIGGGFPAPTPIPIPKPAPTPIGGGFPAPAPAPIPKPAPTPVPKPAPTPIGGGFPIPAPIPKPAPTPIGGFGLAAPTDAVPQTAGLDFTFFGLNLGALFGLDSKAESDEPQASEAGQGGVDGVNSKNYGNGSWSQPTSVKSGVKGSDTGCFFANRFCGDGQIDFPSCPVGYHVGFRYLDRYGWGGIDLTKYTLCKKDTI